MHPLRTGLLLTYLWGWGILLAQNPFYRTLDIEDGLPSNNIYKTLEDSVGRLWIATDFGVVSYNGQTFRTFDRTDGLPGLDVPSICIDSSGTLWVSAYRAGIAKMDQEEFRGLHLLPDSALFGDYLSLRCDSRGRTYAYNFAKCKYLDLSQAEHELNFQEGFMHWYDEEGQRHQLNTHQHLVAGQSVCEEPSYSDRIISVFRTNGLTYTINSKGLYAIQDGCADVLYAFATEKTDIQNLSVYGKLAFICTKNGLDIYDLKNKRYETVFPDLNVQHVLQGRNGDFWIGTHERGLLWVPDFAMRQILKLPVGEIVALEPLPDNQLSIAAAVADVYRWESGQVDLIKGPGIGRDRLKTLLTDDQGHIWTAHDHQILKNGNPLPADIYFPGIKAFARAGPDTLYISDSQCGTGYLLLSELSQIFTEHSELSLSDPHWHRIGPVVSHLLYEPESRQLYGATINGMYLWTGGRPGEMTALPSHLQINTLAFTTDRRLLIGTLGSGTWIQTQGEFHPTPSPLNSGIVHKIRSDGSGGYWICGQEALFHWWENGQIQKWSHVNGQALKRIRDICSIGDQIYLAGQQGCIRIPREALEDWQPPSLKIALHKLHARNQLPPTPGSLWLNQSTRIEFETVAPSYSVPLHHQYRFRQGVNWSEWQRISGREISLQPQRSGNLTLEIAALDPGGSFLHREVFPLKVLRKWHQTGGVWFMAGFFLALAISGLVGLIFSRTSRRRARLIELERQALRSQMNPHFIYNALNSIHVFIAEQESRKAHLFLSKFAHLVRLVLDSSREPTFPLEQELRLLRKYLELEQLRTGEAFDFEFRVDLSRPLSQYQIPSMLIQPLVENAILHGIKPLRTRRGLVSIIVTEEAGFLILVVQDNGIGRNDSTRTPPTSHKSQGTQITRERIHQIKKAIFKTIDLHDQNRNPIGTRCEIRLYLKRLPG